MRQRTILITGGTGKIGGTLARHFLAIGDKVVITARTSESIRGIKSGLGGTDANLFCIQLDFLDDQSIEALVTRLGLENLTPDCLINSARSTDLLEIHRNGLVSRNNFVKEYTLDVVVPYEVTMALVNRTSSRLKAVVNIGSVYGLVASNPALYTEPITQSPIHYSVAKAGVSHLTKELAVRLADKGVRVNCVALGGIEGRVDEAFERRYSKLCPAGRMIREEEVVAPVALLLSEEASSITGHTLVADGGWSIW